MSVEFDHSSKEQLIPMLRACPALKTLIAQHKTSDDSLQQIISNVQLRSYKLDEYVTMQGKPGKTFFFVVYGQVKSINPNTKETLTYYEQLDFFGERSPLYDVTTQIASTEAVLAIFDRDTLDSLIELIPGVEEVYARIESRHEKQSRIEFEGIQPDEVVIRKDKRHILAFVAKLPEPLTVILLGLIVDWLLSEFGIALEVIFLSFIAFVFLTIGWTIYNYIDWANDDFIVTTKRVIHTERTILYGEVREEAPLSAIQDVKVAIPNLFTRVFDYRNIVIQTAGVGNVIFDGLGNGDQIRQAIFAQKKSAAQRVEASNATAIRKALDDRIHKKMGLADVWKPEETPATKKSTWLDKVLAWRPHHLINYLIPKVKEQNKETDTITWRKHYLILLRDASIPALTTMFSFYLLAAAFLGLFPFNQTRLILVLPLLLVWLGTVFWYFYKYDTWRKDIYIVTNDTIIDIKGSPLNLGAETRREGPFVNVQNITYRTPSFLTRLFNMGNVIIETAGTMDTFTFEQVYDYKAVQQEISKRLFAYKQREREKARADEEQRFTRWLGEFHDMTRPARSDVAPPPS